MKIFAKHAWVDGSWAQDVLLETDQKGCWSSIKTQTSPGADALVKTAIVPGMTDAHSHAFQRAMASLTEKASPQGDNFWRWRQTMYQIALSISPDDLREIAIQLYSELLRGGYSHVCEFHYVHHDVNGSPYADPAQMCWALIDAAQETGIGLTLLPTLYMHRGFGQPGLQPDQRRFAGTPEFILDLHSRIQSYTARQGLSQQITAGAAIHSLRAVDPASVQELVLGLGQAPIHIHVAEQIQEVEQCIAHLGARPVQWLLDHVDLNANWHLVHATHTTPEELEGLARSGASVVICPTTEANLGDGVFDLLTALKSGLTWSIGTDSHVNRDVSEELRVLEYSQRLTLRQRNIASNAASGGALSSAQVLFQRALLGGAAASGLPLAGFATGQRADWFELDLNHSSFWRVAPEHLLDAWMFSTPAAGLLRG